MGFIFILLWFMFFALWPFVYFGVPTGLTKRLSKQALSSLAFTIIVAGLLFVFGSFDEETVILLLVIWLVVFALLANTEKIFQHLKKN